jgi:16S rRNA (guanine966-N2)-methyltransferase
MRIIAGRLRGRRLSRPPESITRPTADRTRETIFNILSVTLTRLELSFEDMTVLDVFSGSGALGFEALSRGALSITFIEKNPQACEVIQRNARDLKVEAQVTLLQGDARHLPSAVTPYSLIFLDPPYHKEMIPLTVEELCCKGWVAREALIVIELEAGKTLHLDRFHVLNERQTGSSQILIGSI